jgi:UDP-3-O-[3-hydroxymyristoyl] glucosamine N-acyltransferase
MSSSSFELGNLLEALPDHARDLLFWMRGDMDLLYERVTGARAIDLASKSEVTFWKSSLVGQVESESCVRIIEGDDPEWTPPVEDGVIYLTTPRPRLLLAYLMQPFLGQDTVSAGRFNVMADVSSSVTVGRNVTFGASVIAAHCNIGNDCVIWHNVTIGGDGFSFEVDERTGDVIKLPHFGRVIIGDRVEIQSGTQIARGSLRDTIIEDDVKIDQLVHVAHNCHIKKCTLIPAGAMLAGSVTVGEYSWIAPETAIMNGVTLGRCSMTGLGAVVTKDVGDNELVIGVPARKLRDRFPPDHPLLEGK